MSDPTLSLLGSVVKGLVERSPFASEVERDLHLAAIDAWAKKVGTDLATDVAGLGRLVEDVLPAPVAAPVAPAAPETTPSPATSSVPPDPASVASTA